MKTIVEAQGFVLNKIKEIENTTDLKVEIVGVSALDDGSLKNVLPPEEWKHISFSNLSKETLDLLFSVELDLLDKGISFDTGLGFGRREWELDWSFNFKK